MLNVIHSYCFKMKLTVSSLLIIKILKFEKFFKTQFLKNPNRKLKPQNLILKSFKNKELSFEWRMSTYIQEALHIHVHTSKATLNCATAESIRFMDIAYKPWKEKVT